MRVNNTKTVLTVACFVATLSTPVFGLDPKDFMTKFTQAFEHRYIIKIAHGAVTSENDGKRANGKPNISLNTKDVTLAPDNGLIDEILGIKQKAPIDIVFQGVQENADGSYSVDAIVPDPPTFTNGDASFSGSVFVMKNAHIPAKPGYDVFGNTLHVDKTTISMGSVTYKGKKFIKKPHSLTISVQSPLPISGTDLENNIEDLKSAPKKLGLTVRAND